jgi:hypothetical protein
MGVIVEGMTPPIEYVDESEISKPIVLEASIGNRSRQPAYYTLIKLGIDADIGRWLILAPDKIAAA